MCRFRETVILSLITYIQLNVNSLYLLYMV